MKIVKPGIQRTPFSFAFYRFPQVPAIVFYMDFDKDLDGLEEGPHVRMEVEDE